MKTIVGCIVALLAVLTLTEVAAGRLVDQGTDKRGFRNGAGDRFSHGFGKRVDGMVERGERIPTELLLEEDEMTTDVLIDYLLSHPEELRLVVQRYIDQNHDDVISRKEFFAIKRQ